MALEIVAVVVPIALFISVALLSVRWVHARQAIIVVRRITGEVVAVHPHPGAFLQVPFLDELHEIDLTFHRSARNHLLAVTADGVTMMANVTVGWELSEAWLAYQAYERDAPELKRRVPFDTQHKPEVFDRVLPFFADAESIVMSWTDRILRASFSRSSETQIANSLRTNNTRYLNLLKRQIQTQVEVIGVHVIDLTITCVPAPEVTYARVEAEARAQVIERLVRALGPQANELLRVLALETLGGANHRVYSTLDLGNGSDSGSPPIQFVVGSDWN